VIAAVGHEIDYTIADYVADCRAPTPSAAAEIVAQEQGALLQRVTELRRRLYASMHHRLDRCQQQVEAMDTQRLYLGLHDRLEQTSQYVDERRNALFTALDWYLRFRLESYRTAVARLEALSPLSSLARGFAVCQHQENRRLVRRGGELKIGEQVRLRFHQGGALCQVEEIIDE
jgi:exodeoxyribonuclease VII large subunit